MIRQGCSLNQSHDALTKKIESEMSLNQTIESVNLRKPVLVPEMKLHSKLDFGMINTRTD